jgi:hypothetical protein
MARLYCKRCGTPLPRRATVCLQCETAVVVEQVAIRPRRRAVEWLAVCSVAVSSMVFVVALGLTNLFRDGFWYIGAGSFGAMLISIYCVSKLESTVDRDDLPTS